MTEPGVPVPEARRRHPARRWGIGVAAVLAVAAVAGAVLVDPGRDRTHRSAVVATGTQDSLPPETVTSATSAPATTAVSGAAAKPTPSTTARPPRAPDCGPGSLPTIPKATPYARHRRRSPGDIVYIAWTPGSAGESALWIMAADGSDRHALTEPGGSNISPDLSGDGSRIVWIHEFEVVAMDDQGRITQLTNCPAVPHPTYGMQRSFGSPKWSPDGTRIAVCEDGKLPQVTNGPHCQILVMRADGREQRYIAQGEERAYFDGGPSWLPDGKRVLVRSSPPANDPTGFFTFNLDNGSLERVYTGEGQSPEWGETILYRENRQILTTTPGGTPQVVLSETDLPPQAHFGSATWSHDHTRVIFSVHMGEFRVVSPDQQIYLPEDQQPDWELWSVAPDGTDLKNLSNDPALRQDSPGT